MRSTLLSLLILIGLTACIPVTVRPQFDDQGLPIAMPVTPIGSITPTGELVPHYPVSKSAPSDMNWGAIGTALGAVTTALLAAYGINLRGFAGKAQSALKIACELADHNAVAETDEQVLRNKEIAAKRQKELGVLDLTKKVRGK